MSKPSTQFENPDRDTRGTPHRLYLELDHVWHFTIDVAAAPDNAKCARYFTKEDNGLAQSWQGETVWCNPPYSNIRPWLEKAIAETATGNCRVVMLLPAYTELGWFHDCILPYADIKFLRGRISFLFARGGHAPFASMLVFYPKSSTENRSSRA